MAFASLISALFAVLLSVSPASAAENPSSIEVWKSATCECCNKWVKHLEDNGFAVKVNAADPDMLQQLKEQSGISDKLAACHTAKIGGYVIEGHVPALDVKRLMGTPLRSRAFSQWHFPFMGRCREILVEKPLL